MEKEIAFDDDVITRAAEISEYSEEEIYKAYRLYCNLQKKAIKSRQYTTISLPIGKLYLSRKKVNMHFECPIRFVRIEGDLRDYIEFWKNSKGISDSHIASSMYKIWEKDEYHDPLLNKVFSIDELENYTKKK